MAKIAFEHVKKHYGEHVVVADLNLSIHDKEFVVVVGPSGCGKSTLLRMIAGLEEVSDGLIRLGGKVVNHVSPQKRNIAMVFQNYALYPHMSVRENICLSLKIKKVPNQLIDRQVKRIAALLEIEHLLHRKPKELSGGQKQRVAMGRAMIRNPDIFLFDEPLSNLDAALRTQMRQEIKKIHQKLPITTIYVTHDQVEAMTLADRIVVMDHGSVQQVGSPMEIFEQPANRFVAEFFGFNKMNFIDFKQLNGTFSDLTKLMPHPDTLILGMRPEHFSLDKQSHDALACEGKVEELESLGSQLLIRLKTPCQHTLSCSIPFLPDLKAGDPLKLYFERKNLHVYDGQHGGRVPIPN
ncbi:MAG: ABC transporter ATP-binding protein [Oligoflexales bacterium]|nr:ABC transporter ATP-binding protein [Oligoflexales bacterium]